MGSDKFIYFWVDVKNLLNDQCYLVKCDLCFKQKDAHLFHQVQKFDQHWVPNKPWISAEGWKINDKWKWKRISVWSPLYHKTHIVDISDVLEIN